MKPRAQPSNSQPKAKKKKKPSKHEQRKKARQNKAAKSIKSRQLHHKKKKKIFLKSLVEASKILAKKSCDQRKKKGKIYPDDYLIALFVIGYLTGRTTTAGIARVGSSHFGYELANAFGLDRTPAESTLRNFLTHVKVDEVLPEVIKHPKIQPFIKKMRDLFELETPVEYAGEFLPKAADGKALRSGHSFHQPVPYLVNSAQHQTGIPLSLCAVPTGVSEQDSILDLIQALEPKDEITLDALHTQTKTMIKIEKKHCVFITQLKRNQRTLFNLGVDIFAKTTSFDAETFDRGHGRIETRKISVQSVASISDETNRKYWEENFPLVKTVMRVDREVTHFSQDNRKSISTSYYVSNKEIKSSDALSALTAIRNHWHIENKLHYVLDVTFQEDSCRTRNDAPRLANAAFRRIALAIMNSIGFTNHKAAIDAFLDVV